MGRAAVVAERSEADIQASMVRDSTRQIQFVRCSANRSAA